MKLDYNCLRDLLLILEENLIFEDDLEYPCLTFENVVDAMPDTYTRSDIAYTTIMADEAGLIDAKVMSANDSFYGCTYWSLTYYGHQFLENIRDKKV